MSTSSTEHLAPAIALLLAVALSGCAGKTNKTTHVDSVAVVKPVREQVAAPVAASTTVHVTPVPAMPDAQAMAPAAVGDYMSAINLIRENKFDDALVVLKSINARYPRLSGPLVNEGIIYLRKERWADALDSFDRALKINDKNPYAWNLRGLALKESGKFVDARASYERALALDPQYARAHFNLGVLADIYLQDLPLALAHYEKYQSLQMKPDQAVGNWIVDLRNRTAPPSRPSDQGANPEEETPSPSTRPDDAPAGDSPASAG